ncbi:hypothetical protein PAAG_04561 [Paracoccidioides lutzii Pb01]|uniref:Uncharacterized protein n=1 Tax=Paracoccidioides lutzii (strain ATCC MYA-826 / Pb01) TaxID=502779 RepID=C1H1B7_PARBA|nr:hypothetical protein PAAG_04561 [Paracoccidioides lutzii Pb01]EEH33511.2 hypothetical protein PAAG_04561 [Paracoccidioides lutzii Pb01]
MLKEWYTGTYKKIARIKRTDMGADGLEDILTEFPPAFEFAKPLCRALRDILFPYGVRGIIVGTSQDPNHLYNPIIKAYDDAIYVRPPSLELEIAQQTISSQTRIGHPFAAAPLKIRPIGHMMKRTLSLHIKQLQFPPAQSAPPIPQA